MRHVSRGLAVFLFCGAGLPPGSDWYEKESLEADTNVLRRFSLERRLMRPFELDPLKTSPDRLHKAHSRMLARAEAIADLYAVDYPFVEPPRLLAPKERFEMGSRPLARFPSPFF